MADSSINLRSQILIAMPSLNDPHFNKSIALICEHTDNDGAMGIVLNQPTSIHADELLAANDSLETNHLNNIPVYAGGPVQTDRGFILHDSSDNWESSIEVNANLHLTSSNDILQDVARGNGPNNIRIALGYAGWAPGQLETEISANSWLTVDYQSELVFNTPAEQQWLAAGSMLGIDLNLLSSHPGHA